MLQPFYTSLLLLALLNRTKAFNLDLNRTLTLEGKDGVFFGMSFALFDTEMFVGAPGDKKGIGAVYHCPLVDRAAGGRTCQPITEETSLGLEAMNLGASMIRIGASTYVCAPLYKRDRYHSIQANMGKCFRAFPEGLRSYFTLKSSRSKLYKSRNLDGWRTTSIMGRSLGSNTFGELVIGLPLARAQDFNWDTERVTGSMGVVTRSGSKGFLVPKPERVPWASPSHATESDPRGRDGTGASIAQGRFFSSAGEDYAVGAPKSNKLRGRVFVCRACFNENALPISEADRSKYILDGEQIGSRFGETVISVDLDGNGFDDIVVGAPLYSHDENKYDSGEVYIYRTVGFFFEHQFQRMKSISLQRAIVSKGQFGASLGSLGDIDGDGFMDFVVGAPFEGSGAVYLYRGHADLQIGPYSQKITPESAGIPGPVKGFGYSFSNVADVDENGTPDFGIGALDSDKALIIRSKRVVRISPKSFYKGEKLIEPSSNRVSLELCAALEEPAGTDYLISIKILEVDSRLNYPLIVQDNFFILRSEKVRCVPLNATSSLSDFGVSEENMSEIPKPLRIRANLEWSVHEPEMDPLFTSILSPESQTKEISIAYNVELKSICHNRACHCHLISSTSKVMKYIVGKSPNLLLQFNLRNNGSEPAFNIIVYITADTPVLNLNKESARLCQQSPSEESMGFECNLGFLRSGDSQDYTIGFDVSNPKAYISKDFTFLLNIHPSCSRKPSPPLLQTSLTVTYDNDLYLSHHIEEPDLDYEEGIPRPFSHVYRIENKGHSPLEHNLSFLIGVPKTPLLQEESLSLSYDVSFINCEPRGADPGGKDLPKGPTLWVDGSSRVACDTEETCLTYACNLVQGAPPQTTQNLFLQFVFKMDSTEKDRTESYRIVSFAQIPSLSQTLLSGTKFDSLHRAQIKYLYEFVLPLAGGLILGVILLISLFAILWKTGAFSKMRIYKNKLKEMEEETAMFVGSPYPTEEN